MIKPTIGRVVLYKPRYAGTAGINSTASADGVITHAATVAYVWNDTLVNLAVVDSCGAPYSMTSVVLVQDGEAPPYSGQCCWMPYQIGQAAKTEQLQAQLAFPGGAPKTGDCS